MSLFDALALARPVDADRPGLDEVFAAFTGLQMPFETASNLTSGTMVKSADQIVACLRAGLGGHCLEHATLLQSLLAEAGFAARLVHADQNDHTTKVAQDHFQSYVLIELRDERLLADAFVTQRVYPCPVSGGRVANEFLCLAVPGGEKARLIWWDGGGVVTRDELLHLTEPPETRAGLLRQRFGDLPPFGVLSPFYREVRPEKRSIAYFPVADRLLVREGTGTRYVELNALGDEQWIPHRVRKEIAESLPLVRQRRAMYLAFLQRGMVSPFQRSFT